MEPQMDMQQLFAAAQQMQEQLMNAQQALADAEVTGTSGEGRGAPLVTCSLALASCVRCRGSLFVIDDTELFNDKLQEWEDFYNFHRPHGGLDGQTPYERLRQKTTTSA